MTVDPNWPLVGSKVTLLTQEGSVKARVICYGKSEVRLRFDDERFNSEPSDLCGKAHRKLLITTFLRMVEVAQQQQGSAGGGA